MKVGIIGAGRMGKLLAERMAAVHAVEVYDSDATAAGRVADELSVTAAASLDAMDAEAIVLAVPDNAVGPCVSALAQARKRRIVFSVATNITREILAGMSRESVDCLNVKIIGQAGEMGRGAKPVIVIDAGAPDKVTMARQLFATVGPVVEGNADSVMTVNRIATEEALRAGVAIENRLREAGIEDPALLGGALSHVGPGVLRAYAEGDLGPFARRIVQSLRDNASNQ